MSFDWILQNASTIKDLATSIGVVGTFFGIVVGLWRFRRERLLQRELNAKRIYAGVLRMAFENPELAEPVDGLHNDPQTYKRYVWFVSNVLNALDEILASTSDPDWRATSSTIVGYHATWLASDDFQKSEAAHYGAELRSIMKKVSADLKTDAKHQPWGPVR